MAGLHNYHMIPKRLEATLAQYVNDLIAQSPNTFVIVTGLYSIRDATHEIATQYTTVKNQKREFIRKRFTFVDEETEQLKQADLKRFVLEGELDSETASVDLRNGLVNIKGIRNAHDWIRDNR